MRPSPKEQIAGLESRRLLTAEIDGCARTSATDPKEVNDVLFTFGNGWSVAASNSLGDAALAN
jgi:hypothetical protein